MRTGLQRGTDNRMLSFFIVYEDQADADIGCELADRVLRDQIDWLAEDESLLAYQRTWKRELGGRNLTWAEIPHLSRQHNIRVRGRFDLESVAPDCRSAIRALQTIQAIDDNPSTIVLIRDADDQGERKLGLNQARDILKQHSNSIKVVIGVANTKRECWVLSGFIPCNDLETELLADERQYLGFDPTKKSHELTAKHDDSNDKRSAKRVLSKLTRQNYSREEECWKSTPLNFLRSSGDTNGLANYLSEVEDILVPLLVRPEDRGAKG